MSIIVVDASAMVEYLLRTPRSASIDAVLTAADSALHVPALCDVEVCSALRRLLIGKRVTAQRVGEVLSDYLDMPISRHGHTTLLEDVLQLRENFSAYDATYLALAASLGSVFVTCDEALARGVRHFFPEWDVRT